MLPPTGTPDAPPAALSPGAKQTGHQMMPGPHSGQRASIVPGDPMDRAMGQYGKGGPELLAGGADPTASAPPMKDAAAGIRGGTGAMRRRVSKGGFGGPTSPGKM